MVDKEKIIKLRKEGLSYTKIGQEVGCSKQYVETVVNSQRAKKRIAISNNKRKEKIAAYYKEYYNTHKEHLCELQKKYQEKRKAEKLEKGN